MRSGSSCSKLTMSLVNVSLKFKTLISNTGICQYFFVEKNVRSFCIAMQKLLSLFQQKISVYLVIKC